MYLLGEHKAIPVMASARVHRWAITLSAYQYTIRYKPGSEMCNADALSRVPVPADTSLEECLPNNLIGLIDLMSTTPLSADLVSKYTRCDPVLSRVCYLVKAGGVEWQRDGRSISALSDQEGRVKCSGWGVIVGVTDCRSIKNAPVCAR